MVKKIEGGKSLADRLKEDEKQSSNPSHEEDNSNHSQDDSRQSKQKNKSASLAGSSSVLEKLNQTIKTYKRVGFDVSSEIDDEVEDIVNGILKDISTKKAIYNEILEIGWPIWKKRLQDSVKK